MATLIHFLCSISGLLALLLIAVVCLVARPKARGPRIMLVLITALYWILATRAAPYAVSRWLVKDFHPYAAADVPPGRSVIVVLAAGEGFTHDWDGLPYGYLSREDAARVAETARVFRLTPGSMIISSGGVNSNAAAEAPSSVTMKTALVQLGIPADAILLESDSATTRDEALLVAPIVQHLRADRVILVTSGFHMRRAMGAFRAVGMNCVPAIARDPYGVTSGLRFLRPDSLGLELSGAVIHEYAGLVGYRMRGWYK